MYYPQTLTEFEMAAQMFVRGLTSQQGCATLVTLSGDLGAGKTAFVKACAAALGVQVPVTSPTFVIENRYMLPGTGPFSVLVHMDAYRLESGVALGPLRFDEDMQNEKTLIMLEWPERVVDALPVPSVAINIRALETGAREIDIQHPQP